MERIFWPLVAALLLISPLSAQDRIFRASPIDVEQNRRLDILESQHTVFKGETELRLQALESKTTKKVEATESKTVARTYPSCPITTYSPAGPTVLMITNGACPHCDIWWNKYEIPLKEKGWNVVKQTGEFAGVDVYPTFQVFNAGKWTSSFRGSMSMNDLRGLMGVSVKTNEVVSQPVTSGRYSAEELRRIIHSKRPGGWRGPVYADVSPRSQAKQHLVGSEHGFSWDQVAGLSQDEALILHDLAPRHGNQIFPYRTGQAIVTRSPQMIKPQPTFAGSGSGCPNGQCARQTRAVTSRWFRR